MLELSYQFQTQYNDSWYNKVECRKRSILNMLIFDMSFAFMKVVILFDSIAYKPFGRAIVASEANIR